VGWIARDWLIYKSRQYCNQYDAIISPSPAMQKILVYYGVKTPITAIPTGIDPSHFQNHYSKQDLMTKFQIPPEHDFLFLYVSRVGKEKNVYFLLDAMKKFVYQHNHHNAHLLMIGGGEELEKVKRYCIQLGLSDCVTFAGAQPKDETNKIFGGADAFVFASITETQGIIIQEAQAAGLPVIAVDEMGPGNYINDGEDGLLVPLNSEAFADKMNYLATHPDIRVAMSTKAKENVLKFTAEKCGEKIEEMYERTIANHHRS
jgi:glycosyltransferase involved in cell wall biosynthesis